MNIHFSTSIFSLPYSGFVASYKSGEITSQGTSNSAWSSTAIADFKARYLYHDASFVGPESGTSKVLGFIVRCLVKHIYQVTTFSLPYSGFVHNNGSIINRGSYGLFWASGANTNNAARDMDFINTSVWLDGNNYKSRGYSLRCLTKYFTLSYFSLPYSGYIAIGDGREHDKGGVAGYWTAYSITNLKAATLDSIGTALQLEHTDDKPRGRVVRCPKYFPSLYSLCRIREMSAIQVQLLAKAPADTFGQLARMQTFLPEHLALLHPLSIQMAKIINSADLPFVAQQRIIQFAHSLCRIREMFIDYRGITFITVRLQFSGLRISLQTHLPSIYILTIPKFG